MVRDSRTVHHLKPMDNNLNNNKAEHITLNIIILMSNLLFLVNINNNDKKPSIILHRTINNLDGRGMGSRGITTLMARTGTERHCAPVVSSSPGGKTHLPYAVNQGIRGTMIEPCRNSKKTVIVRTSQIMSRHVIRTSIGWIASYPGSQYSLGCIKIINCLLVYNATRDSSTFL